MSTPSNDDLSNSLSDNLSNNLSENISAAYDRLMTIGELQYAGAFKLPSNQFGDSSLNYAKGVIEVNGDSMFIVGHTHHDAIAEFKIPELVNSVSLNALTSAGNPVQAFSTVLDRSSDGNAELLDEITGLEIVDGSLIVNAIEYYDGAADNTSTTLVLDDASQLSTSPVSAIHQMHGAARAAGWISHVPEQWQQRLGTRHITGYSSGEPIIGRLSVGPSAFAVNFQTDLSTSVSKSISTEELQGFSLRQPLHADLFNDSGSNMLWTHLSQARYGFAVPGTSTYMTIGYSGGHQSGLAYKTVRANGEQCPGYCANDESDVYNHYWLWNMEDWERVKSGDLWPYEMVPYESGRLTLPFQTTQNLNVIGGASFDETTGLLYISILEANTNGDNNPPVIVAYRVPE